MTLPLYLIHRFRWLVIITAPLVAGYFDGAMP